MLVLRVKTEGVSSLPQPCCTVRRFLSPCYCASKEQDLSSVVSGVVSISVNDIKSGSVSSFRRPRMTGHNRREAVPTLLHCVATDSLLSPFWGGRGRTLFNCCAGAATSASLSAPKAIEASISIACPFHIFQAPVNCLTSSSVTGRD